MSPPVFRTVVPVTGVAPRLRHADQLFLLGSCFSDEVGARLAHAGHSVCVNPLGTLFNPTSMAGCMERLASGELLDASEVRLDTRTGLFYTFEAGTLHSCEERQACLASVNGALEHGRLALSSSRALFLTLGSAWAYVHRSGTPAASRGIVANCHRQPQEEFRRRLLSVDEIAEDIRRAIGAARRCSPNLSKVVLTVSPVRHWREGALASSRSKAHLLAGAHQV